MATVPSPVTTQVVDLGRGRSMRLQIPVPEGDQVEEAAQIMGLAASEVDDQLALLRGLTEDASAQLPTSAKMSAVVWPASQSFASLFTHCPSFVKDCRVLELGCGLGTVGIAAAMAGATTVLLTDLDEVSLAAAQASADLNGVGSRVRTARLDVTSVADCDMGKGVLAEHGPFDVIIGSDVLFSAALTPHVGKLLAEVLRSARSPEAGGEAEVEPRAMLADPSSRGNRALLEAAGAEHGLAFSEMALPQILPGLEECVLVNMVLAEE